MYLTMLGNKNLDNICFLKSHGALCCVTNYKKISIVLTEARNTFTCNGLLLTQFYLTFVFKGLNVLFCLVSVPHLNNCP